MKNYKEFCLVIRIHGECSHEKGSWTGFNWNITNIIGIICLCIILSSANCFLITPTPAPEPEPMEMESPNLPDPPSQTANYTVSFVAQWSARTHPTEFPLGAHFSPLVIAVHNNSVSFWELGMSASNGIEIMAETGSTFTLRAPLKTTIALVGALGDLLKCKAKHLIH